MYSDRLHYSEIPDDADAYSDIDILERPKKRRTKGLSIIIAVACVIALGLAASFYQAAKRSLMSEAMPDKDVRKALKKADIIPDIISDFGPTFSLRITWPKHSYYATLGNKLEPKNLQSTPQVFLTNPPYSRRKPDFAVSSIPVNNIILTMTDPDAPSRSDPKWSEFCHWIAAGIPLVNISSSEPAAYAKPKPLKSIMSYRPPGPPPKTGKHRYVFLAFAPRNATSQPLYLAKPSERRQWGTGVAGEGVKSWAREMGLSPIAANFIYAENDDN